ncbi:hypothetical protein niasHS_009644 [Heterodera schachtii]|uniref:Uncharacterized protein n=1 Tax=Heterodera schachtii TaxID=97005 RepID=A0ABD2J6D2_HETSC
MNNFIILFTTILLFFIVHMSTLGVDGYGDFNHPDQHAMNAFFGPTNPYEHPDPYQSTGHGYYGQPAGGFNNYGQSGGFYQQPHSSSGYRPNPPYSNGISHQPISNGNFGRSHSENTHQLTGHNNSSQPGGYRQQTSALSGYRPNPSYSNNFSNQPVSNGNLRRSRSDVRTPQQSTSYSTTDPYQSNGQSSRGHNNYDQAGMANSYDNSGLCEIYCKNKPKKDCASTSATLQGVLCTCKLVEKKNMLGIKSTRCVPA